MSKEHTYQHTEEALRRILQGKLPGGEAHRLMAPRFRRLEATAEEKLLLRESAALLVLTGESMENLSVLLTVRSSSLRSHSGQISFPGGKLNPFETHQEAALREAEEEVNLFLNPAQHLIGQLSPIFIPATKFAITPYVAYVPDFSSDISPNPDEVDEVLFVPLSLLQPQLALRRTDLIPNSSIEVPYWDIHPTVPLWGATAMILAELHVLFNTSP